MIQVLHRALNILELIAKDPDKTLSLTEIADAQQLNYGTCANILKTLVDRKYVEQVGYKKGYRLGAMAYYLTGNLAYKRDLMLAAKAPMEQLTLEINETSLLGVIINNKRVTIYSVESEHALQARSKLEREVYETATGRLLLAFKSEDDIAAFIEKYGLPSEEIWAGMQTKEALMEALRKIKNDEFVKTHSTRHIVGLAVPIRKNGEVVASLSVFLPEIRFTKEHGRQVTEALKATATQIEENLGS